MNNPFAQAAKRTNRFSIIMILASFLVLSAIMFTVVQYVIIGAMEINNANLESSVLDAFATWDEGLVIEDITLEMRQAVYQVRGRVIRRLDQTLLDASDKVYLLIRVVFMFSFVFTFCIAVAISRSFVSTLDMQMSNLGPASLRAVSGTIEEMLNQYDIKDGRKKT